LGGQGLCCLYGEALGIGGAWAIILARSSVFWYTDLRHWCVSDRAGQCVKCAK